MSYDQTMRRPLLLSSALLGGCIWLGDPEKAPFEPWDLPELSPSQGFGFDIPEFSVAAGEEVQDCYFVVVPGVASTSANPVWVERIVAGLNPGSHHFNVFRVNSIVSLDGAPGTMVHNGECFKSANWADWPLVFNTQRSDETNPVFEWELPDGVAHRFMPGEKLMLQVHYVNASTQDTPYLGKAEINFHRAADSSPIEMGTLFATQQSIRVCQSNPNPTYAGTCSMPAGQPFHIDAANGHFHSHGKEFQIFTWDGVTAQQPPDDDRFYRSTSWDHPPMLTGLDTVVPDGGGVWWTCEYVWQEPSVGCDVLNAADTSGANDCCYIFGPKVESSEHCNIFLYYWPKAPVAGDIFCN